MKKAIPSDFPIRIKSLRVREGITQLQMAQIMGVSFVTVNRWENRQSRPSQVYWKLIERAEQFGMDALSKAYSPPLKIEEKVSKPFFVDFSEKPEVVQAIAEGKRLQYGYLFNSTFAAEISLIDPLPHQRTAVYENMLNKPRLRFLLADDAGAGKTIMAGLYIREMLSRRLIQRILIVPPAGLVGNWRREMQTLFRLPFEIVSGLQSQTENPFAGPESNLRIVSVDTLAGEKMFSWLQKDETLPYDLVIFDEAHKLSAYREPDLTVRKTDRYKLAEALAGIQSDYPRWSLSWSCRHLLLLTATPHMGKDYPYYCLWKLLEPEVFSTFDAFRAYPRDSRKMYFIRRTKEKMVRFNGSPIYPTRKSDTLSFDLTQGEISEQTLYDLMTEYIRTYYNKASILNRSAARLVMSVFQRRMASSTYALLKTLTRRKEKLEKLIKDIQSGAKKLEEGPGKKLHDVLEDMTADEESIDDGKEENETAEDEILEAVAAVSLKELNEELSRVESLEGLAQQVFEMGQESKLEKLLEVFRDPQFKDEKTIVFTEHRDTLEFLVRRLESLGFTGRVAHIHGGMNYLEREAQVEFFRKAAEDGGATYLVATDAAGEGINLQFCALMVNYDIPWNPARLEQRMGRIHRYGQKKDPVIIINLVAGKTREGKVLKILLEKLEIIRRELSSDNVFDIIGRFFQDISLKEYMEQLLTEEEAERIEKEITRKITKEEAEAFRKEETDLLGESSDLRQDLPRLNEVLDMEKYRRLLPGYVRSFIEKAAPLVGLGIEGNLDGLFAFTPLKPSSLDFLWPVLETYLPEIRNRLSIYRPKDANSAIFLHPGEALFDRFLAQVTTTLQEGALRGAKFLDPNADQPYMLHLALITIERKSEPTIKEGKEILEYRLLGLRQNEDGTIGECPADYLLLLKGSSSLPRQYISFAAASTESISLAETYARDVLSQRMAENRRRAILETLTERESFLMRGYDYQEADLAKARSRLAEKFRSGDAVAKEEYNRIKERQARLSSLREEALAALRLEPDLVQAGEVTFLAHALVLPSSDPEEQKRYDQEIENRAVKIAWAYEEERGAQVRDVSTPDLACKAGLQEHPGFDLLSCHPQGEVRSIEVKGRAGTGDIEPSENEWAKACNLRERYWLYVVFDCATSNPRLYRVQDPFGKLIAMKKGGVIIDEQEIIQAAEGGLQ